MVSIVLDGRCSQTQCNSMIFYNFDRTTSKYWFVIGYRQDIDVHMISLWCTVIGRCGIGKAIRTTKVLFWIVSNRTVGIDFGITIFGFVGFHPSQSLCCTDDVKCCTTVYAHLCIICDERTIDRSIGSRCIGIGIKGIAIYRT